MHILDSLILNLTQLPGIGKKTAARLTYFLLKSDPRIAESIANSMLSVIHTIQSCTNCGNYSENQLCHICSDPLRDASLLCVVEQASDINIIEYTNSYNGYYFVLHGVLSPIDGIGPIQLRIPQLLTRLSNTSVVELILATNPTVEGDTTALYIKNECKTLNVICSRLALGLPVGGDLEYSDKHTIARAISERRTW